MMFSIESRLPFLDHQLVEYCMGIPNEYKIQKGYNKYILREAIEELPEAVKYRKKKMGFVAPDAVWMKRNHAEVRNELKKAVDTTGLFSDKLLTRFDHFNRGNLGYEPIYMRALSFSRLVDIFNISLRA